MGELFKTIPEVLEFQGKGENGASKFYQSLMSILPHLTFDNFMNTRIAVKHDEVVSMDDLGDVDAELCQIFTPLEFVHQVITAPEVIAMFIQDTGISVEQLDSYICYWSLPNAGDIGVSGLGDGFVIVNGTAYCFKPTLCTEGIFYRDVEGSSQSVAINDGNELLGRPAIKSIELQVCGELAELTPVEVSVDVIEDGGSQS